MRNDKLQKLRVDRGWTIQQLAVKAQVSTQTIRKAEKGRIISDVMQARIANALDTARDRLFPRSRP